MRWCSLPIVCREAARRHSHASRLELSRVVAIVRRVCRLRVFTMPMFPRACVRQSLGLFRELTRMGYPVAIHFGVRREGTALTGHSWVTVEGSPIAEVHPLDALAVTYSYSAIQLGRSEEAIHEQRRRAS